MRIAELAFQNFRCFGNERTAVPLDFLTSFIGSNGCGKTAVLHGLAKLFGANAGERIVEPADFYLSPGKNRNELPPDTVLTLVIEAKLTFPELESEKLEASAVPQCFRQMMVTAPGASPFCRIRLEATWTKGNLPDGYVEQRLLWVRSEDETPDAKDVSPMAGHDRSRIHVHYVPAARDPSKQIRFVSGTIFNRILGAVNWSEEIEGKIEKAYLSIRAEFSAEAGVSVVESSLNDIWKSLHDAADLSGVRLRPAGRRLEELLRHLQAVLGGESDGKEQEIDRLSDGLKSLFYLAIVGAAFRIEDRLMTGDPALAAHFDKSRLDPPLLTIFALEEPENHVAPHYLGRIVKLMRDLIASGRAQAMLTSHSPAILQRVEPTEIRHLRIDTDTSTATVKAIKLPPETSDAFKFIREAVKAYPELYFARLVVLGEGDSEEIVIPRIARAHGVVVDTSFISIAPLGGRHVNHFWRLLSDLGIPYVTLLDLDRERHGGGWGRIEYAMRQLLDVGMPPRKVLEFDTKDGVRIRLSQSDLDSLGKRDVSKILEMRGFLTHLETLGVFFSTPLDFDFLMLQRFPATYTTLSDDAVGPRIPTGTTSDSAKAAYEAVIAAVLKPKGGKGKTYSASQLKKFFWYRYLFLGRGKPVTHLDAMSQLSDESLLKNSPQVVTRLCNRIRSLLASEEADDLK